MSQRELDIGSFVQFTGFISGCAAPEATYRIEQLMLLGDGAVLYKIRNDAEPFDRVVADRDLIQS
jgi:hypothetical protein